MVTWGAGIGVALAHSVDLARAAETGGYRRVWYAEHHNMPSIASSATAVLIAHVAAHTQTIRLGAGGIMLPNHSPLVIAEQFGTLAELHPGRIDLGLGRAPGTDMATARALRRHMDQADEFPQDVVELLGYLVVQRHDRDRSRSGEPELREQVDHVLGDAAVGLIGVADLVMTDLQRHRYP